MLVLTLIIIIGLLLITNVRYHLYTKQLLREQEEVLNTLLRLRIELSRLMLKQARERGEGVLLSSFNDIDKGSIH